MDAAQCLLELMATLDQMTRISYSGPEGTSKRFDRARTAARKCLARAEFTPK